MVLLRKIDAVMVTVPSLDEGLRFYRDQLGHPLRWRNDSVGQAAVALPEGDTELVLTTTLPHEAVWLVDDVNLAAAAFTRSGGAVVAPAEESPVGRVVVVNDPFGNRLVLIELSRGRYVTDADGQVTGVESVAS